MHEELFELGKQYFEQFQQEFISYGVSVSPNIQLFLGKHILPYYDLKDGNIYLSNFDPGNPAGKLQLLFIRSLLSCESSEDFFEFYRLTLPWMIGHELGHHLRQHYGKFGKNLWQEEQIANYLAFALTKHRFTPQEKAKVQVFLRRAIEGLSQKMQSANIATVSYSNILHALQVSGQLDYEAVQNVEMLQRIFAIDPENSLITSGQLSHELVESLHQRDEVISTINQEYTSDIARYLYYHLGWMFLGLTSREAYYVDEFAVTHLGEQIDLLEGIGDDFIPNERHMLACYRASLDAAEKSETAGHYFYKRYRTLLVSGLKTVIRESRLNDEAVMLLESWTVGDFDTLNYLAEIVPEELRYLLPNMIGEHPITFTEIEPELPTDTDRRVWRYVMHETDDIAAMNTLMRLELLDKTDIYRVLSAEVALEVMHNLRRVKLAEGEIIIRQGDLNNDVFILNTGKLGVSIDERKANVFEALLSTVSGQPLETQYVGMILPGDLIGEVAFFSREARNASVMALEPSECYVLKASDLQLFAYNDPAMLMQMAGALAHRLTNLLRKTDRRR